MNLTTTDKCRLAGCGCDWISPW